jgi:hypothetical protein
MPCLRRSPRPPGAVCSTVASSRGQRGRIRGTTRNVLVFDEMLMKHASQTMRLIPWFVTFIYSCHVVCDETNVRERVL